MPRLRRGGRCVETGARTVLTSTATGVRIRAQLDACEGDRRVHSRNWQSRIDRYFV